MLVGTSSKETVGWISLIKLHLQICIVDSISFKTKTRQKNPSDLAVTLKDHQWLSFKGILGGKTGYDPDFL